MKESNKIKKSILYNSIGSFTYLFCQWIITFIVVWIAGYKTAGILSLAMTVSTTYTVIASFNMRNYQASDIKNKFSEKTYITSRIITCLIALILTIIYSLIKQFKIYQLLCIIFYMIFKLSEALVDVIHGSLQKKWRFDIIGLSFFIRGLLTLILFTLTLLLSKNILLSIIIMMISTYIFIYFYDIKNYKKEYKNLGITNKNNIIKLLIICIPLVIYGFLFNYVSMYPKVTLENILGTKMLGYYSTVATPALIIQVACSFIFSPLVSHFAELYDKNKIKELKQIMNRTNILIIIIGITGILFSHFFANFFLTLLFGKEIAPYTYLFSGVIIVSTIIAIIWFLGTILTVIRDYKTLLLGAIISLLTSLILSKMMINKFNLNGVNYTLIIAYSIQTIIYLISIYKLKKEDNNTICYVRSTSIINDSRATKEIESLINNNYNVYVIGWDRDKRINDYKSFKISNKKLECSFFKFNSTYGESKKNIIGLLLFQIYLFIVLIKNNKKYKYIHACDFDCGFISNIIAKMYNKKLVYDMYDYYTDSRPMPAKLEKIVNKLENNVINNAEVSIICGEWRKKQIKNSNPKKLVIIHNTPNLSNINYNRIIKSNSKKEKIVYVGILQDHRLIMETVNELAKNNKFELHIGGFGKYENEIKKIAEKHENIYFYGSLKYNDVLCLEKDCDVLLATYDPNIKNHKYSAPNKVYEAMALGKPIIVCKNTGIDELVEKNNTGFSINYDAKELIKKLEEISKDKKILKLISSNSKKMYEEKYNWQIMEKRLINIYSSMEEENDNNSNTDIQ